MRQQNTQRIIYLNGVCRRRAAIWNTMEVYMAYKFYTWYMIHWYPAITQTFTETDNGKSAIIHSSAKIRQTIILDTNALFRNGSVGRLVVANDFLTFGTIYYRQLAMYGRIYNNDTFIYVFGMESNIKMHSSAQVSSIHLWCPVVLQQRVYRGEQIYTVLQRVSW